LLTQQKFLNDLTDQLPGAVYQLTRSANGKYAMPFASQVLTELIGFEPEELREDLALVFRRLDPSSIEALQESIEDSARDNTVWRQRLKLSQLKENTLATTLQTFAVPQARPDGTTVWHGFITDISDMVRIEDEILQARTDLETTIEAIPDSLISLDPELKINLARSPQNLILGQPLTLLQGKKITDLLGNSAIEIFKSALEYADQHGHIKNVEFTVEIGRVLTHFECSIACKPKTGATANGGYVVTIRDVTQRKETEQQVALLAYRDSLTGLLNRRALLERLERIHGRSLELNIQYAILFIDLDNFKDLNDAHGHHVGDELLRQVALRFSLEIRHTDVLARLGGDEFLVVVHELTSQLQAEGVAVRTAQSLNRCMQPRFQLGVLNYEIACSIGVAFGPGAVEVHQVMQHADIAMYQAKASGRDRYYVFDNALQSEITYKSAIAQDLRHAIGCGELLLHYQPIVDPHCVVVGYEALIRWKHPVRGMVPPNDFIPAAEQNGLIVQIGSWVLQTAVSQLLKWAHDAARDHLYISVNVSALQVQRDDFVEITQSVIEGARIDPKNLKLELTESVMHSDLINTIEKMKVLRSFGLEFSLDDFGTGYSSMSYVRQLPLSQLKIDRSFIVDLPVNTEGAAIATMITQLAKTLRLGVVAEGVETEAQFQYLRSLGCQYFQGYLFGSPAHC
jgi:diguanylate cyclase (GGDEF)-like protein